jgi:hypothetical protein
MTALNDRYRELPSANASYGAAHPNTRNWSTVTIRHFKVIAAKPT